MGLLVIQGGIVYNPCTKKKEQKDLVISGNSIALPGLDAGEAVKKGAKVVQAEGCLVVPGLIDYHIHLFTGNDGGVNPDAVGLPSGVTTEVDGGTCGASNFSSFVNSDAASSIVRVKAYLNVASGGLATGRYTENVNPDFFEKDKIKRLFNHYPDILTALKFRISRNIVETSGKGLFGKPLEETVELAGEIGCPVVVHMNNPVIPPEEASAMLRPGDVFCHMYYGDGDTILDEKGRVKPEIWKARERGVVFDACNGRNNFAFKTAVPAVREGFIPDIISTDISPITFYKQPAVSLPYLLSKYMGMGLSLEQVIDCATINPARLLGMEEELGSLNPGTEADIAVFKVKECQVTFGDYLGDVLKGDRILVPQMTIKGGEIVYCQMDFNCN